MSLFRASTCFALVAVLTGCAQHNSLVGTWKPNGITSGADVGTKYNADGTGEDWFKGRKVNAVHTWKWKLEGDKVYYVVLTATGPDGVAKPVPEEPWGTGFAIRWISKDQFEQTDPKELGGGKSVFTRRAD